MKKIVVFNGIHGAGKSTVARLFAERNGGFTYYPEIGGQLRQEVSYNALQSKEDFDLEVMRRELARDRQLFIDPKIPLVETWHVGNMAYALTRNPHLFPSYQKDLNKQLLLFDPTAILLDIGWDTFRSRATEKIASDQVDILMAFYQGVLENTIKIYGQFDIPYVRVRNEGDLGESIEIVAEDLIHRGFLSDGATNNKERGV